VDCRRGRSSLVLLVLFPLIGLTPLASGQNSSTGQIVGTIADPSRAVIPQASVSVTNAATGLTRSSITNSVGEYTVPLLSPGTYTVTVSAPGFKTQVSAGIGVMVATTSTVNLSLEVGQAAEVVHVDSDANALQTEDVANGGTTGGATVTGLPLSNHNYTQILALLPGVSGPVANAATLGKNNVDVNVNGSQVMDNSYQMDGQDVSNMQTQGTTSVVSIGGISVPSPDSIQEFKVQTSLYDAAYGRGAGANVDVVTKSGTDAIHGSLFEFNRNTMFNANDYFLNSTGQPRPELKQNQFGATIGGPILKHKLFYFGSYQGTREVSGEGAASLQSVVLPPLTNDRSAAALGQIFCGKTGFFGGIGVACNGSNINPTAQTLLNYKLANGSYYIPTPQVIQNSGNGFSSFSIPSSYIENQYMVNTDYAISEKHQLSQKAFWSKEPEVSSFTSGNVPGSGVNSLFRNVNASLKDTYEASASFANEANAGWHQTHGTTTTNTPLTSAELGITPTCNDPVMPIISVSGSFSVGGNFNDQQATVSSAFAAQDQVSWQHSNHSVKAGFGWERIATPFADPGITRGTLAFESFPDFLLGMSAAMNGSAYSNVYGSEGLCGNTAHSFRVTDFDSFVQDDYRVSSRMTLNVGLRWDIYGAVSDATGRLVNFWPQLATNNFGTAGTYSGFIAVSNFPDQLPAGVARNTSKTFAQNAWDLGNVGPRLGLSWQPANSDRIVVHAGYGVYYSRSSVNPTFQLLENPPFFSAAINQGVPNAAATFQVPFNPAPPGFSSYPVFSPRTATSSKSVVMDDPKWQTPITQQWGANIQYKVTSNIVWQVGYVGTRGSRVPVTIQENQPYLAPYNGVTTNTIQNASQRVPYLGLTATGLSNYKEGGASIYHALQTTLSRRMSRNTQFGVSYTYSKALSNVTGTGTFPGNGGVLNDNTNLGQNYGPADYDTRNRFIANYLLTAPDFRQGNWLANELLSQWALSGVVTVQSGPPLTFTDARSGTIYGTSTQRAQFCPGESNGSIPTSGSVKHRLNDFFNTAAFCAPPTIGNGYGFGDTARGIARGPGQYNADIALMRQFPTNMLRENSYFQFRAEAYNALNTPQFSATTAVQGATPITQVGTVNFGQITAASVAPRLFQLGLKYIF
jgi:Carboxypeptidase regulatory-like domain